MLLEELTARRYVSPFEEGMNAARKGVPWTRCPYAGIDQGYDTVEWLRGHRAQHDAIAAERGSLINRLESEGFILVIEI